MIKVVFWNIKRKNLLALAGQLALDQDADILVLAENTRELSRVLDAINTGVPRPFISDFTPDESLVILHRYPKDSVRIVSDPSHMSIRKITPPLGPIFLLVAVHLPSRLFRNKDDLGYLASSFVAEIDEARREHNCNNVIVIGDLNMNPFDDGLCAATAFHAVMDKTVALEQSRIVDGKEYRYFYNPMWSELGDNSEGPPGTYYYRGSVISYFWNTFDQVLISPELVPFYAEGQKHVITQIGNRSLVENNRVANWHSDHLPIMVRLHIDIKG